MTPHNNDQNGAPRATVSVRADRHPVAWLRDDSIEVAVTGPHSPIEAAVVIPLADAPGWATEVFVTVMMVHRDATGIDINPESLLHPEHPTNDRDQRDPERDTRRPAGRDNPTARRNRAVSPETMTGKPRHSRDTAGTQPGHSREPARTGPDLGSGPTPGLTPGPNPGLTPGPTPGPIPGPIPGPVEGLCEDCPAGLDLSA